MGKLIEILANDIQEIAGYQTEEMMRDGLLHPHEARKWIVKLKYYQMIKQGMKGVDAKWELCYRYGMSISAIEKLIYGRYPEGKKKKVMIED